MNRLLMIIDPQIDFITGTLPVPGAVEAMNRLAEYIRDNDGVYSHKIVTADRHPFRHCSFTDYGGIWQRHCVHDTAGAAVWQPLFDLLYSTAGDVTFLHKGEHQDTEEYSIFSNIHATNTIRRMIKDHDIGIIDLCGIAGDVCVAQTLTDGIALFDADRFRVLTEYTPSIDGGTTLSNLINHHKLCDR